MKSILILLGVFAVFGTQAQSKKKINQQLLAEFAAVERTADSIALIHDMKKKEIARLQTELVETDKLSVKRWGEEEIKRADINFYHEELKAFNFDSNKLVSINEIKNMTSPAIKITANQNSVLLTKNVIFKTVPETLAINQEKLRVQNELIRQHISETILVNEYNKVKLEEEETLLSKLINASKNDSVVLEEQFHFNNFLDAKMNLLAVEFVKLKNQKIEEQRILYENQEAALKLKNGSNKTVKIVPPIVSYKQEHDSENHTEGNVLYGNINPDTQFDFVMPLEETYFPPPAKDPPVIYDIVDEVAAFPGGQDAFNRYLANNLKFPEVALEKDISGKVYLRFVVSETGNLSNVTVKKGIPNCIECDEEAVRVVKKMPDWTPGKIDGKSVNSWYTLPITFKLPD